MVAHTCNPNNPEKLRQEDYPEFDVHLDCIVGLRPTWATELQSNMLSQKIYDK